MELVSNKNELKAIVKEMLIEILAEQKKNRIDERLEFVSDSEMNEILENFDMDKLESNEFVDMTDWVTSK